MLVHVCKIAVCEDRSWIGIMVVGCVSKTTLCDECCWRCIEKQHRRFYWTSELFSCACSPCFQCCSRCCPQAIFRFGARPFRAADVFPFRVSRAADDFPFWNASASCEATDFPFRTRSFRAQFRPAAICFFKLQPLLSAPIFWFPKLQQFWFVAIFVFQIAVVFTAAISVRQIAAIYFRGNRCFSKCSSFSPRQFSFFRLQPFVSASIFVSPAADFFGAAISVFQLWHLLRKECRSNFRISVVAFF